VRVYGESTRLQGASVNDREITQHAWREVAESLNSHITFIRSQIEQERESERGTGFVNGIRIPMLEKEKLIYETMLQGAREKIEELSHI
jgi:hypothetical protein